MASTSDPTAGGGAASGLRLPLGWPPFAEVSDATVNVEKLHPTLIAFLAVCSRVHYELFGQPLTVTSGNDGTHSAVSKHYKNEAVDIRTSDKSSSQVIMFLAVVNYLAVKFHLAVFNESQRDKGPHVHVETA